MELPMIVQGEVGEKRTNNAVDRNGVNQTYYSIKLIDRDRCDNMPLNVSKEIYDQCKPDTTVRLAGYIGGLKNKYFKITQYLGEVKTNG